MAKVVHVDSGPIGRTLFSFALPVLLTQLLQELYNAADCAVLMKKIRWTFKNPAKTLIACITGSLTYVVLYMLKTYVYQRWVYLYPLEAVGATMISKLIPSLINALFAVIAAPLLFHALYPALRSIGVIKVSGVSEEGAEATVLQCDLATFEIKQVYAVPDELAGMVQITKIQDYYYISVSTDKAGNQDVATIVRTKSLEDLTAGEYEDIYSTYFLGGGTLYHISSVGDTYFLTEHRLTDHALWSFKVEDNEIADVQPIF